MKKGGLTGILIFGLFWTALVGTFDGFILYNQFRQIRAIGFPQTTGTVTHSEVTRHHGSNGGRSYTYAVTLQQAGGGEKLADWYDQARAASLAAWLRERMPLGEPEAPPRKAKVES